MHSSKASNIPFNISIQWQNPFFTISLYTHTIQHKAPTQDPIGFPLPSQKDDALHFAEKKILNWGPFKFSQSPNMFLPAFWRTHNTLGDIPAVRTHTESRAEEKNRFMSVFFANAHTHTHTSENFQIQHFAAQTGKSLEKFICRSFIYLWKFIYIQPRFQYPRGKFWQANARTRNRERAFWAGICFGVKNHKIHDLGGPVD